MRVIAELLLVRYESLSFETAGVKIGKASNYEKEMSQNLLGIRTRTAWAWA